MALFMANMEATVKSLAQRIDELAAKVDEKEAMNSEEAQKYVPLSFVLWLWPSFVRL